MWSLLFIFILIISLAILLYRMKILFAAGGAMALSYFDASKYGGGQEFGAKFLDVDVEKLREKLQEIGATKVHDRKLYRRVAYRLEKARGFARVRDEGDKVTMTVKIYSSKSKFPEEYEVTVAEDFNTARKFMENLGMQQKAYKETYREKWAFSGCNEIAIDTIPGLPTYVEIDCASEAKVTATAPLLGFDMAHAHYGSFALTYEEEYGIPQKIINEETPILTFESAKNALAPHVIKNKEKFHNTIKAQLKLFSAGK